jgi:Zn-finger nucleic acid-binding protein
LQQNAMAGLICPNCRQPMQTQSLEKHGKGAVQLDLCFACAGIWFDHLESVQLAPSAVIELFKEIYAHRDQAPRPQATRQTCPRCRDTLVLSFDVSKTGQFSYFRCPRGDGRFTPFFQFLREKQFVRNLTELELRHLRSQIRQIRCSECGAPIDLEHDSVCKFCRAPVSFLDAEAVEKAVHMWSSAADRRPVALTPTALGDTLQHMQFDQRDKLPALGNPDAGVAGLDLIAHGIHAIGRLFERDP